MDLLDPILQEVRRDMAVLQVVLSKLATVIHIMQIQMQMLAEMQIIRVIQLMQLLVRHPLELIAKVIPYQATKPIKVPMRAVRYRNKARLVMPMAGLLGSQMVDKQPL